MNHHNRENAAAQLAGARSALVEMRPTLSRLTIHVQGAYKCEEQETRQCHCERCQLTAARVLMANETLKTLTLAVAALSQILTDET